MPADPLADSYFARLDATHQPLLEELRALIFEIAPDAVETIDYTMPTDYTMPRYALADGRWLCAIASRKDYISFYTDPALVNQYRTALGKLSCGKSCIRFRGRADAPLPVLRQMLTTMVS